MDGFNRRVPISFTDVPDFSRPSSCVPSDFICDFGSMEFSGKEILHYNPFRNDFDIVRETKQAFQLIIVCSFIITYFIAQFV